MKPIEEIRFARTVQADIELAKLCPDNNLSKLKQVVTGKDTITNLQNIMKVIVILSEAYENKKWAFVSDVARLWGLYTYGGIYMDTDVTVFKPLDKFLVHECFTGFESPHYPIAAVMGSTKNNEFIKELLSLYDNKTFEVKDNWYEYETNTIFIGSEYLIPIKLNGKWNWINTEGEFFIPNQWFDGTWEFDNGILDL